MLIMTETFNLRIVKWLEDKKIYQRERKSNKQRALGMLLYNAGLTNIDTFVKKEHILTLAVKVNRR